MKAKDHKAARRDEYCLVLSGGGAKGIYHVGVWKALKKLGIEINAVIGNSIGAIIAGFLVQGEDFALEEIAGKIGLDFILKVPDELIQDGELKVARTKLPTLRLFYRDFLERKGLDTTPLRKLLLKHLDEDKIRGAGKDLGVVTFNLTEMKSEEVFVDEMPAGTLIDYLMASAAFPGFERPRILGKNYVDGGVYDNMPYGMARRRGYRRIIIVDIAGIGLNRRPNIQGGVTVYIKSSIKMGGALDFSRKFLDDFMNLGYLDTLRTFDYLKGYKYFLTRDDDIEREFTRFLRGREGQKLLSKYLTEHGHPINDPRPEALRLIFPRQMRYEQNLLLVLSDCAADFVEAERIRQYSYRELFIAIKAKRDVIDYKILGEFSESRRSHQVSKAVESILRTSLKRKQFDRPLYHYYKLLDYLLKPKTAKLLKTKVLGHFPMILAAEFFLVVMDQFGKAEGWNN
ncbi:MAG: patatin-like phospholipase family protein [Spirochaetales bacterium]|jgi:NTE family protein|nr:patatin-like phospholipase family protein [Spirochaetales bacterium]